LGYIQGGQLYDLTATGRAAFATFEAWLQAAAGRVAEALAELNALSKFDRPLGAAEALLSPQGPFKLLAPLDTQEVWACGVTYEMSMEARQRESTQPTMYGKVYDAPRPEVFFKAPPHRVVGPGEAVGVREDSAWDVPEPELTLVVTSQNEIVGFTVGNDMSSRDIEGQNPLYLPQAKVYNRCCALGPFVRLATADFNPLALGVKLVIYRNGQPGFSGESSTSRIHRKLEELVSWLARCNSFPTGLFVVTGTGIVPPDTFTLKDGDVVEITIQGLGTLSNPVTLLKVN
jgi:2-dehydro-3-deoxy-D-arabinonate dehydratase